MDGLAIVPLSGGEGYTYLSRSRQGKLFKKHILSKGQLHYPKAGGTIELDDDFFAKLTQNFQNKVCDIVQVPVADDNNNHTENPLSNIGEVIGLTYEDDKLYATIDARDDIAAAKLGKTLLGASAMMHLNYTDTRTMTEVGPTLLHVAVTNRPYVVDLDGFSQVDDQISELIAASVDGKGEAVVLTSAPTSKKEKKVATLDELYAELRADHGIDVPKLQERAAKADAQVELSNKLTEKLTETLGTSGILTLSNGSEASVDDIVTAVAEVNTKNIELTHKVDTLLQDGAKAAAKARVDKEMRVGKILPKDEDAQVELLLSNPTLFESLLPEKPLVKLSQGDDEGIGSDKEHDGHAETAEAEILRLTQSGAAAPYIRTKS